MPFLSNPGNLPTPSFTGMNAFANYGPAYLPTQPAPTMIGGRTMLPMGTVMNKSQLLDSYAQPVRQFAPPTPTGPVSYQYATGPNTFVNALGKVMWNPGAKFQYDENGRMLGQPLPSPINTAPTPSYNLNYRMPAPQAPYGFAGFNPRPTIG